MICRANRDVFDQPKKQAFVSYSHSATEWRERILAALDPLVRDGYIAAWHDGMIMPGENWHVEITSAMADATIVLMLITKAFIESDYVRNYEVPFVMDRAQKGKLRIVPIILESCAWPKEPFARFQALPGDRLPLAERSDTDAALKDCLARLLQICSNVGPYGNAKEFGETPLLQLVLDLEDRLPNGAGLISALRESVGSSDIWTNMMHRLETPNSGSTGTKWSWLIQGSPAGFTRIESLFGAGELSKALGINVESVGRTVGASYFAGTYLCEPGAEPEPIDRRLPVAVEMDAPRLHGIAVRPTDPEWLFAINTKANNDIDEVQWQIEKAKYLDYFYTGLAFVWLYPQICLCGLLAQATARRAQFDVSGSSSVHSLFIFVTTPHPTAIPSSLVLFRVPLAQAPKVRHILSPVPPGLGISAQNNSPSPERAA